MREPASSPRPPTSTACPALQASPTTSARTNSARWPATTTATAKSGRDYIAWRKTLGAAVVRFAGADGDGSAIIDQADYTRWRSNFGAVAPVGPGAAFAVPEPASITI